MVNYDFTGYPAPSLGLLIKICTNIETWLSEDPSNIAVVHCYVRLSPASSVGRQGSHDAGVRLRHDVDGLVQLPHGGAGAVSQSSQPPRERDVSLADALPAVLRQPAPERAPVRRRAPADQRDRRPPAGRGERRVLALPGGRGACGVARRSTTRTDSSTPATSGGARRRAWSRRSTRTRRSCSRPTSCCTGTSTCVSATSRPTSRPPPCSAPSSTRAS